MTDKAEATAAYNKVSAMLDHPEATIEQVAAHCGFKDTATFFHRFKSITGDSPRVWISKQ